ncbi:MAG: hypothetical protein KDA86_08330 [Planctomycetaceae bacterium]|nr:hypothetical protein [Planctomycetaceae bacterium]
MTEFLAPVSGDDRFALLVVSVVMFTSVLIPIASVGFVQWRKVRERETAAGLIHDMLARGCSTEEIERVLQSAQMDIGSVESSFDQKRAPFSCRS